MTNVTLSLNTDSIHFHVRRTIGELYSEAESIRRFAVALEGSADGLLIDASPGDLRQVAVVVKTCTTGVLLRAAELAYKAERLETIAEIRDLAEPPSSDDEE